MDAIRELEAEEHRLKAERAFLMAELARVTRLLDATRVAIGNCSAPPRRGSPLPLSVAKQTKQLLARISRKPRVQKVNELVLEILMRSHPEPLKAADIRREALKQYGVEINQNTLTTSLARYRSQRVVTLVHKSWLYLSPSHKSGWG